MKFKTGRYYMIINDGHIDKWTHKYLTSYIRIIENKSYAFEGPQRFGRAVADSDFVILVTEDSIYYVKDRVGCDREVNPDEYTLVKLASIELSSLDFSGS